MNLLNPDDIEILGEVDPATVTKDVIANAERPIHMGIIETPDGTAQVTGICEDTVEVSLKLEDRRIAAACFQVNGCGFTIACGNMACHLVTGREIENAVELTGAQIETALGGLPKGHRHCADLAAKAMQLAAEDASKTDCASRKRHCL